MEEHKQLLILSNEGGVVERMRAALSDASDSYELVRVGPGACAGSLSSESWDAVVVHLEGDLMAGERLVGMVRETSPELPLIVVVQELAPGAVPRLLDAGAHHVLAEPDLAALRALVQRLDTDATARARAACEHEQLEQASRASATELAEIRKDLAEMKASQGLLEAARRESDGRYRALVDHSPDGVATARDGRITSANARLASLFEYARDELSGLSLLDLVAESERDRFRSLQENGEVGVFESFGVKRSGETFPMGVSVSVAVTGEDDSVLVMVRDMTEQAAAREALSSRERREGAELMAEGVAQNFSNIMGVVSGYAASIAESFLPGTQPHRSASRILDATRHASHLTQQLLNLAKPVDKELSSARPVSAAQVIRDVIELAQSTMDSRSITLEIKGLARMPLVLCEGPKLLDVLLNVLLNAADAMPHGGKITINCHQRFQVRRGSETGVYAIVTVRDEGRGMRKEQAEHAFDPFYTTKHGGTSFGLGLPVSQRQVQGWGGWIDLRSAVGKGTRVRIFLRRADGKDAEAEPEGERTVLVVDDSRAAVAMMTGALEKAGYEVLKAFSGDEALTMHQEHQERITLCVIDWIMPGTDGRDVLAALLERDPNSNVLMTSGFSRDYCRSRLKKGGWGFLQKPFSVEELLDAVRGRLSTDSAD
jgi:two-component system cell cycle sensor histidine kinase/response regulator CckA